MKKKKFSGRIINEAMNLVSGRFLCEATGNLYELGTSLILSIQFLPVFQSDTFVLKKQNIFLTLRKL